MSGLCRHYRQVTERTTRYNRSGLVVRLDPKRRARPTRLVVAVTVDEGAEVVGRGAVGSRRGGVLALAVCLGRTDGGPALELPLRAAALDEHLAVGLDRGRGAGEMDLAARQGGHVLGDVDCVQQRLH